MNTRRVQDGERRRANGWASASEYDILRPIDGTAVALKTELVDCEENRELLFFLQAMSLSKGGIKRLSRELLEMFPERIGTRAMRQAGCRPGMDLTPEQQRKIEREIYPDLARRQLLSREAKWAVALRAGHAPAREESDQATLTATECLAECRRRAESLDEAIEQLCCDPTVGFDFGVDYFRDLVGALQEYKRRFEASIKADFVETSIGAVACDAFNYALETGRSALIEGNSGFGKTTALKACCSMNLGRVRYLQLEGITNRTTFAQKLSDTLGVACGKAFSPARKLIRCQEFLRRTKLMLVIDEGQYLWPQGKRIVSHPELINWLNTACYNEGVPYLISATKQFTVQRQAVERQTDWSSEQARRRTRKVFQLPDLPTKDDLLLVARKLLKGLPDAAARFVVGYAMGSKGYFQTIVDAIDDAKLIARRSGRAHFTAADLQVAVKDWRAPSDAALQRVYDSKPINNSRSTGRGNVSREPVNTQANCSNAAEQQTSDTRTDRSRIAEPLPGNCSASVVRRGMRPEGVPALTG